MRRTAFPWRIALLIASLSNSIEVNGSKIVLRELRITRTQEAFNPEMVPRLRRQFLQCNAEIVVP